MNDYAFALLFFLFKRRTNGTIESVVDPFRRIGFGLLLLYIRGTFKRIEVFLLFELSI